MIDTTPPVKRPRGRPKGSTQTRPAVRRDQVTIALEAMKKQQKVTNSFLRELERLQLETEKLAYCEQEYNRVMALRDKHATNLARAIKKMAKVKHSDQTGKVNLNAFIPIDLMREFTNILEESPLNRNEIISNLILNYIKAHKGFSRTEMQGIAAGVHRLEKQEYRNTKVAAEMLVHAPYDAVRHHNPTSTKKTALDTHTHDSEYARRVDQRYTKDEVVRALEKGTGDDVDMSDLFGEVER